MFRENLELQERLGDVRKAAAVGAITRGIAHNLNNLLGVVVGYLDLIKNGYDSPDMVKRSVSLMDHAINRMVGIIRQLSTIANNERLELSDLPVRKLIEDSVERFKSECEVDAAINIELAFEDHACIPANAETFEIVLGKLLMNAWESYPKQTAANQRTIQIGAAFTDTRGERALEITVADEGGGISDSVAENLFEPFITTKTSIGRGMGLTIARHTMRNLEGEIRVENRAQRGVTATLIHPA